MKKLFFVFLICTLALPVSAQSYNFLEIVWEVPRCPTEDKKEHPVFFLHIKVQEGDSWHSLANRWAGGQVSMLTNNTEGIIHPGDQLSIMALPRDLAGWRDNNPAVFDRWVEVKNESTSPEQVSNLSNVFEYSIKPGPLKRWEKIYQYYDSCM